MIRNIKMVVNGKEIQLPSEIKNMLSILGVQPQQEFEITSPLHPIHPGPQNVETVMACEHGCKDLDARKAIFGLDKRLTHIEDYLKRRFPAEEPKKEPSKKVKKDQPTKVPKKKSSSNVKKKSKK